ncbi:FG-GAP-like repeat-containing protein [Thiorhodovibrio litoralis]|uniref:FG-GAP-like repeat-containing protein n=1 Tax=Thiorhodovibrio litoralis TaxID=2952932 RepID=UPI002B25E16C|nr:FG-GAP-like repeat-containing protein [Thiorhodovibrio litoralis]WPL11491.1 FG-GAP repeat [Thiorhodovibrio litoralis]
MNNTIAPRKEVVFLDTTLADWPTLADGVRDGVEVVLIEASHGGLARMAAWAARHSGYDAMHLLSHGTPGALHLGSDKLVEATLNEADVQTKLKQLGQALSVDGDLLLYGCDLAAGLAGQRFIQRLSEITDADVAASINRTGQGGDWRLEATVGTITTPALQAADYGGALAPTDGGGSPPPPLTLEGWTPSANSGDIATDANLTLNFNTSTNLNNSNVLVWGSLSGDIGGYFTYSSINATPYTATFHQSKDFQPGETVSVSVTSAVGGPKVFQFTVATDADSPGAFSVAGVTIGEINSTNSVALGDVDGDGDLDVVQGNAGQTQVWLNDGSGGFGTPAGSILGSSSDVTTSVALGDVDGDGDLDVLRGNAGQTQVWLNDGSGGFGTAAGSILGSSSDVTTSVALGDVDGDGDLDVVQGNDGQETQVWLNNGIGGFGTAASATLGSYNTRSVALGDVDGDGDLDVVQGNFNEPTQVWLNDGSGGFGTAASATLGSHATTSVALGDVDGDGDLDVVQGNNGEETRVWMNNGSGGFGTAAGATLGSYDTRNLALGDVDGDGDLDVVEGNQSQETRVWLNDGSGGFGTAAGATLGSYDTRNVALGDVDGDGDLDVVQGNYDQETQVWLNQPPTMDADSVTRNDTDITASDNIVLTFPEAIAGGSYDSDSIKVWGSLTGEVTGSFSASGETLTFDPTTDFKPGETVTVQLTTGVQAASGAALDEGHSLQFTVATDANSPGAFSAADATLGSHNTRSVALGDVDGDGDLDVVQGNNGQETQVWLNDGSGGFGAAAGATLGSYNTLSVALGDVDGDGDLDVVQGNYFQETRVWLNNGSGGFGAAAGATLVGISRTTSVALGDVDGDGDLDVVQGNDGQETQVWLNNGSGGFGTAASATLGSYNTRSVALGDVDGDGDLDVVQGNFNEPTQVWLNNGSGGFGTAASATLGSHATTSVALGDVDGDGDLDVVQGNNGEETRVWMNNGSGGFGTAASATLGSQATNSVTLGDVDGDGDLDVVQGNFFDPTRVWLNDGSGGFGTAAGVSIGEINSTNSVALGDVDGDGDLDAVQGNDARPTQVWLNVSTKTIDTVGNVPATFVTDTGRWADLTNDAAPSGLPRGLKMPLGQFAFQIDGLQDNETANITMLVDGGNGVAGYFKQNDSGQWVNLATDVTTIGNQTKITFAIQDNGPWDSDSTSGRIVDPGGLGQDLLAPKIAENTTYVGDMSDALDLSGLQGAVTYSITDGADQAKFTIDALTGVLRFADGPDYETPTDAGSNNIYDVTVTATDSTSGTSSETIPVTVINDTGEDGKIADLQGDNSVFTVNRPQYIDAASPDLVSVTSIRNTPEFANGYLLITQIEGTEDGNFSFDTNDATSGNDGQIAAGETISVTGFTPNAAAVVNATQDGQNGHALRIEFNDQMTESDVEVLISSLQYTASTQGNRTFSLFLNDGANAYEAVTFSQVPAPTITSATYNSLTGALVVTGTNFVSLTGDANDIDLSTLTFTGAGGSSAAFTLTTTSDIEITDATTFTATLSGSDKDAVDALLDANGTQSSDSTTYNLAAADDWNGPITRGDISDTTGNGITVSGNNSAPTINSDGGGATGAVTVAENSTAVTTVEATDADSGDTLTYSLSGGADQALFQIDANSGALSFINAPDFENPQDQGDTVGNNTYEVEVKASDGAASDTQTITVTVTDVNENTGGSAPPSPPPSTPTDNDGDGIDDGEESKVPALPGTDGETVTGDGNGDGTPDNEQEDVASLPILDTEKVSENPDAPAVYVTLAGGGASSAGAGEGEDPGSESPATPSVSVTIQSVTQSDAPAPDERDGIDMPLGLIGFEATAEVPDGTEHAGDIPFSLLVEKDPDIPDEEQINGFWKQDSAGSWVNLASPEYGGQVTEVGGKVRLDFVIEDNGPFDSNPAAGAITDPGAPGYRAEPLGTTRYLPDSNDRILVDGTYPRILDFGGQDTYTLAEAFIGDVRLVDNQASIVNLPEGLIITGARLLADGLELSLPGGTLTLLGAPEAHSYVFGGDPDDPEAGTLLTYTELAHVLDTTVPAPGSTEPHQANVSGAVQADGTIAGGPGRIRYLDDGDTSLVIDSGDSLIIDFGGADSYQLQSELSRDVTLVDNQVSQVYLPEDAAITSARFLTDGLALTIQGHTVTLLGAPETFHYILGEEELNYTELAEALGPERADTDALSVEAAFAANIDWEMLPL